MSRHSQLVRPDELGGATSELASPAGSVTVHIASQNLGSTDFRRLYGIRFAYLAGSMYKGIASAKLVVAMGKAGLIGYFGAGGLKLESIADALERIATGLDRGEPYGANLISSPQDPDLEMRTAELYLQRGLRFVEGSGYTQVTPALVRLRASGLRRAAGGDVIGSRRVLVKLSRPEVAEAFMKPAPPQLLQALLARGYITEAEAALAAEVPVADDLCVEADSAGHTDRGNACVLLPAILILRRRMQETYRYRQPIHVGLAGGIGTPDAAAAAFTLGADFIMTGSINQCTAEADTSDAVKDVLQDLNVQDTDYAPSGDLFEIGAQIQVVKRGLLFAPRAKKLYETWLRYNSLDDLEPALRKQIEEKYFGRSFDSVWQETEAYYRSERSHALDQILGHPKKKMAAVFRWYFTHTMRAAREGRAENRMSYQIHCGPALGAFNQWVKGSALENWRNRHVGQIAELMMTEAAAVLQSLAARSASVTCAPADVSVGRSG